MDDKPDETDEILATKERLLIEQKVQAEHEAAKALLKTGEYKEALKKFKWTFSHDASRRLYLSATTIKKLAKNYPSSITVLRRWRNDKERLIIEQKADSQLIRQWHTLNECLGDKTRTIDVFLKLQTEDADERLLHSILNHVWQKLARSRKYILLKPYLKTLGFYLLLHAVEYDCALLFPGRVESTRRTLRADMDRHIAYMKQDGTLSYEVALGLKEERVATVFRQKVLSVETSDSVYAGLIKAACRARAYPEAIMLFGEARKTLTVRQLRHTNKAIRGMPKGQLAQLKASGVRV